MTRVRLDRSELQDLCEQMRTNALDPVRIVEESLTRANSNSSRNTYLWSDPAWTREQAAILARRFPEPSGRPSLYGLPVSLKDCFDLAGAVTTCGTRFYAQTHAPAAHDSAIVSRLIDTGAIITGKTHMNALAYGITGENRDFGDCQQPGRPGLLTGGSSSGAAASVLEGSSVAAIGTDTGGSIRVPAALCGLAGYRSSLALGRNFWRGAAHLAISFDAIGWLFRNLEDGPWLGNALFGFHEPVVSWESPRIAVPGADFLADCEAPVRAGYEVAVTEMVAAGATCTEIDTGFWGDSIEIFAPIQAHEAAKLHAGHFAEFEPGVRERLSWGASIPEDEVARLHHRHDQFRGKMQSLFAQFELLLLPAAPVAKLEVGADHSRIRARLLRYTTPFSLAGLPVVTLPAAFGIEAGAVQLAAAPEHDAALLEWSARIGRARRRARNSSL